MNLSQLYYFRKLLQTQNYTKAAKELFISQPALSESIHSLEGELGVKLFQRKGRGVTPTDCGIEFGQYVDSALATLDSGIMAMKSHSEGLDGIVRIGVDPCVPPEYLGSLVKAFRENVSNAVGFDVVRDAARSLVIDLKAGKLDVAIVPDLEADGSGLSFVPVFSRQLVACVSSSHPLSQRRSVSMADLEGFVVYSCDESTLTGSRLRSFLESRGIIPSFLSNDEVSVVSMALVDSDGCAVVVVSPSLRAFSDLKALPIEDAPYRFVEVGLLHDAEGFQSETAKRFVDFASTHSSSAPHLS